MGIKIFYTLIITCIVGIVLFTIKKENSYVQTETVFLCGKTYEVEFNREHEKHIQHAFNVINNTVANDTFPKPGTNSDIYKNLSIEAQTIKYNARPFIIAENICQSISTYKNLGVVSSNLENGIGFLINNSVFITVTKDRSSVHGTVKLDDKSGMGGVYKLN